MKKLTVATLTVSAFTLASVCAFASSDREEFEQVCLQAAMDESIAAEEIAGFIADCVANNLAAGEGEDAEEKEATEGMMSDSE